MLNHYKVFIFFFMKGLSEIFQFSIKNGGEENWMKCPRLWLLPIFGKCHLWYGQVAQILYSSTTTLLSPDYNACTAQGNIRKISISRRKNFTSVTCLLFTISERKRKREKDGQLRCFSYQVVEVLNTDFTYCVLWNNWFFITAMNGQHFVFYIPHFPKLGLTIVLEIVLTFSSFLAKREEHTFFRHNL